MTTFSTVLLLLGSDSGVFLVWFLGDEVSELAASAGAVSAARSDPNNGHLGLGMLLPPLLLLVGAATPTVAGGIKYLAVGSTWLCWVSCFSLSTACDDGHFRTEDIWGVACCGSTCN